MISRKLTMKMRIFRTAFSLLDTLVGADGTDKLIEGCVNAAKLHAIRQQVTNVQTEARKKERARFFFFFFHSVSQSN